MKISLATVTNFICFLFIFLFTYTALSKLLSFEVFGATLNRSPIIGNYSRWLAYAIPGTELVIAALLFSPRLRSAGLFGSFVLMAVFTLYIAYMLFVARENLPCSCGGILQQLSWQGHLWVNVLLTASIGTGKWLHQRQIKKLLQ